MAMKAGRVGVNPSSVDELGNVTVEGITPEERAKLEKALVAPTTTPTEKEVVGVGTANEQIMVKIGEGLELAGATSPYTLKSLGGGFKYSDISDSSYGHLVTSTAVTLAHDAILVVKNNNTSDTSGIWINGNTRSFPAGFTMTFILPAGTTVQNNYYDSNVTGCYWYLV